MKVNLGCGSVVPAGWVNADCALGARLAKLPLFTRLNRRYRFFGVQWSEDIEIVNLRRRFPWPDASVDVVYCSHMLEHLTKKDGHRFLLECYRVLRTGGIVRIVVPDFRYYVDEYLSGRLGAEDFVAKLGVLFGDEDHGLKGRLAPFYRYPHKCMYDEEALLAALGRAGFTAPLRALSRTSR
jgi:SAM-dependent methyltransferase